MGMSRYIDRLYEIEPHPLVGYVKANTQRWYQARRGRLTASKRAQLIALRMKWDTMQRDVEAELDPGWQREEINSVAMSWGRDNEAAALADLEFELGYEISDPGLIVDPEYPFIAGTPDGVFTRNGKKVSVQVKCPYSSSRHLDNFYSGRLDEVYWYQVQWEAMLLRADEIAFVSYDPRQPLTTRMKIIDVPVLLDKQKLFRQNAVEFAKLVGGASRHASGKLSVESGIPELF